VAVDWGYSRNGRRGDLRLTAAGEAQVDRVASPPLPPIEPIGSDWQQSVMPLLSAARIEQDLPPERCGGCMSTRAAEEDATLTANARPQGGLSIEVHFPLIPFAMPR
jgi:hypothetical protein